MPSVIICRMTTNVRLSRAYDPPGADDGYRLLVDRVWPRGVTRDDLRIDEWARDLAPSTELRRWFAHRPERWEEFARRYRAELAEPKAAALLDGLAERASHGRLTVVFGARDRERNQAVVIADLLAERLGGG
jgi:uncharacterized protein YeaO (DUF488 family)